MSHQHHEYYTTILLLTNNFKKQNRKKKKIQDKPSTLSFSFDFNPKRNKKKNNGEKHKRQTCN